MTLFEYLAAAFVLVFSFSAMRIRYFSGLLCCTVAVVLVATFVLDVPLLHPSRATHAMFGIVAIVGLTSESHRVHVAITAALIASGMAMLMLVLMRPGTAAP